jgi:hypothetical protein
VTSPDPDAVQVLAQVVHRVWCLPGSALSARYSQRHRDIDTRLAGQVITGMAEAGYAVTTKEGQ